MNALRRKTEEFEGRPGSLGPARAHAARPPRRTPCTPAPGSSVPLRVFVLVLSVAFLVEAVIMLVLSAGPRWFRESRAVPIVDSLALVVVLCPAFWLLIVRPLRALLAERGRLLSRTLMLQEDERARLARDLHDDLGQTLTATLLGLRCVAGAPTLDDARRRAEEVQQMAAGALDAARRIARGLSPTVLTDLGLAPALRRVCEDVARASGIEIACDLQPASERPDPPVEIAIYRVAQEALTNAARHSGATYIRLALRFTDTRVRLTVTDNGRGFSANRDAAGSGVGLASMRERVSLLGGVFEAASRAGVTTIRADLPRRPVPS